MRVVMNGLAALKPKTGVGHYVARLHAAMGMAVDLYPGSPADEIARFMQRYLNRVGTGVGRRVRREHDSRPPFQQGLLRMLAGFKPVVKHFGKTAIGIHFAHQCRAAGYDLYHEPNFIPFSVPLPTVITVHDLSVLLHPEWHPTERVTHHERHFLPAIRRARHVVTVSHQVRRELIERLGVPREKVTAVLNGVGSEFRPIPASEIEALRRRLNLPARHFLCVGTVEPRKNLLTLLRAFADLPARYRRYCPLVLAGPWGWKSEPEREYLAAHRDGVISLGYVAAEDLPALYASAAALLYPSHYEGFGLPPVEALACGTRVVASRSCAAVREVLGPHGTFVDATDVVAWRAVLKRIAWGEDARPGREAIAHARQFTWERAASETLNVYRRVLELKPIPIPSRVAA